MRESTPAASADAARVSDSANTFAPRALPAPDPGIGLWICDLERDQGAIDTFAMSLSPAEHARAARFGTDVLRKRWIVGRATLRFLLGAATGIDPAEIQLTRGVRGRPELVGPRRLDFNVSHTDGIALIGIAHSLPVAARIGVDLERTDRRVNADRLARKFLTAHERAMLAPLEADQRRMAFLRLWTCKEAMSKATGDALSAPFRQLDVQLLPSVTLQDGPSPYTPANWRLIAADAGNALIGTVAVWNTSQT